jgi:hypothetical protein
MIIAKAGYLSQIMIGYDIGPKAGEDALVPATGKIYFLPCAAAAHRRATRWQVVSEAIKQLPNIAREQPNILMALDKIEKYLAGKPASGRIGLGIWLLAFCPLLKRDSWFIYAVQKRHSRRCGTCSPWVDNSRALTKTRKRTTTL